MSRRSSTMVYTEQPEIGYELEGTSQNSVWRWIQKTRAYMREEMTKKRFHLTVISLVAFDLLVVMIELIVGEFYVQFIAVECSWLESLQT